MSAKYLAHRSIALSTLFYLILVNAAYSGELVHHYQLNGDLTDSLGGPDLIADGGTLELGGGYSFAGQNDGLRLVGPQIPSDGYAIEIEFYWETLPQFDPSWYKIVDFMNRTNDSGLYAYTDGVTNFWAWPDGEFYGPANAFQAGVPATLLITRDATTDEVTVWVDGVEQFTFVDLQDHAVISTENTLTFFEDDSGTEYYETGPGFVRSIRIYNGPVLSVDIDVKPGSYPNSVNLGSNGVVPVAILSTPDFDATTVDESTVELAGAFVAIRGRNHYLASEEDVNGDGLLDLVCHISTENLDCGTFQDGFARLSGRTVDGMSIEGWDEITVVPQD